MRGPIYEPTGAAAEYGKLALNIYTGCPHRCAYCYAPGVLRKSYRVFSANVRPRDGIVGALAEQLGREDFAGKTVFLCFTCDPYPKGVETTATRECIKLIKAAGVHVKILTKRPMDALVDFDLLDSEDWFGTTITGADPGEEPGAEDQATRKAALEIAHEHGIRTWASCEPVLDPHQVYLFASEADYVDLFAFGKLNHRKSDVDWAEFGHNVSVICRQHGRNFVIKKSLANAMEGRVRR